MIDQVRLEKILEEKYHDDLVDTTPTITIDYNILDKYYTNLADQLLTDYPRTKTMIENTINQLTRQNTTKTVLFKNIPLVPINQIHNKYRDKIIGTEGTVRKVSTIYNQIHTVAWRCNTCGENTVYTVDYQTQITPPREKCKWCNHKAGYELDTRKSIFKDVQKFTLQENLENIKSGFKPASIEGFLEDSQVEIIKPGDKVKINGIVELRNRNKTNKFKEYLMTENIQLMNKEYENIIITPEDIKQFKQYAETKDMIQMFKNRIAPSLHGYDELKEAITLQLFGAETTTNIDGTYNRGDIHILLIGDPGIGKSQILNSVVNIVPRGIYTSGKSSSGAGLTASAVKDENESWTLEAGAMVLADKGHICIDEFDKMRESDRSSIHEAMEQQTISMAKAGNIITMKSRCSVLAAANPKFSKFTKGKTIQEQINLKDALLSRFDLIFIIKDVNDREHDRNVALSILRSKASVEDDDFDFKKYISYAKKYIHPVEDEEAQELMVKFYQDWRQTSYVNEQDSVIVTARQFMGLQRLAHASARARLSDTVTVEDVKRAIRLEEYCIQNTGYTVDEQTEPMKVEDKLELFKKRLPDLAVDWNNHISHKTLMKEADMVGVSREDATNWLRAMDDVGYMVYSPDDQVWSMRDYEAPK